MSPGQRDQTLKQIQESAAWLKERIPAKASPDTLVILGSGFGGLKDMLVNASRFNLGDIPHMKTPQVQGHGGELIVGSLEKGGAKLAVLSGRIHLYEGYTAADVVFPVRVMATLGVKNLLVTNAAGGLNDKLHAGDVLVLKDQINLTGTNCLIGAPEQLGARFVDMINCYDAEWRESILKTTGLKPGIYLGLLGPTYETPAETRLFGSFLADAVGMSTVQEVIAARQLGLRVAGLSFITNLAAGLSSSVNHGEVLDIGRKKATWLQDILVKTLEAMPRNSKREDR